MKKVTISALVIVISSISFSSGVHAWDDCPLGITNDPYPGQCSRYVDTDGDGYCDHGQTEPADEVGPAASETESAEESESTSLDTDSVELSEGEHSEEIASEGTANPYNISIPLFSTIILYALSWFMTKTKLAKKHLILSLPVFKMIWNSALVVSAVPSVIFGFYLTFRYVFPILREVRFNFLYWHVEGSIVFGTVVILHLWMRLQQYVAPLKLFRKKKS